MTPTTSNRVLWIAFYALIGLAAIAGTYLLVLQSRGVPTPQEETQAEAQETILDGTYVCLPHTDGSKPKACTPGIKTGEEYYALDLAAVVASSTLKLVNGTDILAAGTITPIEDAPEEQWKEYPVKGILRVTELAKK